MFMLSFRLSRKRMVLGAAALVLAVGLGVTGHRALSDRNTMTSGAPASETTQKVKAQKVSAKSNEDRIAFIQSFGWEVKAEPAEVLEVIIPEEFDAVYQEYNSIQKKQGYNLESYAGKRCKRYSYVVTNHPGTEGEVRFNLILSGDKVIGGDVCSLAQNGFMHGFAAQ